jgi:hypothetical protein
MDTHQRPRTEIAPREAYLKGLVKVANLTKTVEEYVDA